jgi:hypothetical protein
MEDKMNKNKIIIKNTITINGKELSWDYSICPCLTCELYLNKIDTSENCYNHRCTYHRQRAKDIANEIFFIMHNFYCDNCDLHFDKEDYRDQPYCPVCGNSFR